MYIYILYRMLMFLDFPRCLGNRSGKKTRFLRALGLLTLPETPGDQIDQKIMENMCSVVLSCMGI